MPGEQGCDAAHGTWGDGRAQRCMDDEWKRRQACKRESVDEAMAEYGSAEEGCWVKWHGGRLVFWLLCVRCWRRCRPERPLWGWWWGVVMRRWWWWWWGILRHVWRWRWRWRWQRWEEWAELPVVVQLIISRPDPPLAHVDDASMSISCMYPDIPRDIMALLEFNHNPE